ncbi:alpha/beta hydrolase [Solimonas sp. K1W22B-7]|uniref:alpha/beta hydrolase n=1 Tax=Solimonas sp. K1W22B-7 TaxID=2303331 RepID=UPI0013C3F2F7|nr:alpha/beta hydrolase [Solimonas sp. K1W22B-7]
MLKKIYRSTLRVVLKPVFGSTFSIGFQRHWSHYLSVAMIGQRGARANLQNMNGVPAERVTVGDPAADLAILYLHGGGYNILSARAYRALTGRFAKASGVAVHVPDYRLAPEHPHPAALEDALSAYRWLRKQGLRHIAIAGDSAGGGLALATAVALRDAGEPMPVALALISPWVDLASRGETYWTHVQRDPQLTPDGVTRWARAYTGDLPLDHPLCSPLYADLKGLPPMLIHVGSEEILLSDSLSLKERARVAGVDVQLREFEGLWHDFQVQAGIVKEGAESLKTLGAFLRGHLNRSASL